MKKYENQSDELQRDYIIRHLDESMFVEAGAGAGKTSMIVKRITAQLESGIRPEKIVAITFTNAAAEELRGRIIRTVKEEAEKTGSEVLSSALKSIENMQISTIHSFCGTLLREKCFEAGLPIGFKVLEPDEGKNRRRLFFEKWFSLLSKDEIERLYSLGKGAKGASCKDAVFENYVTLCEVGPYYEIEGSSPHCEEKAGNQVATELAEARKLIKNLFVLRENWLREAEVHFGTTKDIFCQNKKGEYRWEIFSDYLASIEERVDNLGLQELEKIKKDLGTRGLSANPTKAEPYFVEKQKDILPVLESHRPDILAAEGKGKVKGLSSALSELNGKIVSSFNEEIDKLKAGMEAIEEKTSVLKAFRNLQFALSARDYFWKNRAYDELDQSQLLEKTKELLENHEEIRRYYFDKFACIYVDEFQDTDPTQEAIIWSITTLLDDENLDKGKLFVVGDPKQAIYRFRGADPKVYFDVRQRFEVSSKAGVFQLNRNYRSDSELISFINKEFREAEILHEWDSQHFGGYQAMEVSSDKEDISAREENKELLGSYQFVSFESSDGMEEVQGKAASVPLFIKYLVEHKYQIRDRRKEAKERFRDIIYGDFMVLFPTHREMGSYVKEFEKLGIKTQVLGEVDLDEAFILKNFLKYYKFLSNPYDKESKISVLELLKVKLSLDKPELSGTEKLCFANQIMDELLEEGKRLNPYGKILFLMEKLNLLFSVKDCQDTIVLSMQTKLQQMVETIFSKEKGNEEKLALLMEDYMTRRLERELLLEEGEQGVVRLINFHKAKGLEANIVMIPVDIHLAMIKGNKGTDYRKEGKYYPNLKGPGGFTFTFLGGEEIEAEAKSEEAYEKMRLKYVAETRAKEVLIEATLINPLDGKEEELEALECRKIKSENLDENFEKKYLFFTVKKAQTQISLNYQPYYVAKKSERELLPAIYKKINPSGFERASSLREGIRKKYYLEQSVEKKIDDERPTGNIFGTVLHRVMEVIVSRYQLFIAHSDYEEKKDLPFFVKTSVKQAIMEAEADITLSFADEEAKNQELLRYETFLMEAGLALVAYLKEKIFIGQKQEILTELPFSYYEEEAGELKILEKDVFMKKEEDWVEDGVKSAWVNGTADLVVLRGDKAVIYDYKSDYAPYIQEKSDFEQTLSEKYKGQLKLYRHSIHRLYGIEKSKIQLVILYFKDYGDGLKVYEYEIL